MIVSSPLFGIGGLFVVTSVSWPLRVLIAAFIGLGVAIFAVTLIAGTYAVRAPRAQRDEARALVRTERQEQARHLEHEQRRFNEMDASHREAFERKGKETEHLRGLLGDAENELRALRPRVVAAEEQLAAKPLTDAAPVVGTELRDIRRSIETIKNDGAYPRGFHFPTARWNEYEPVLAQHPEIHTKVGRAYAAAHELNKKLDQREAMRREQNTKPLGIKHDDELDKIHGLAGEALDVLNQHHNEPVETPLQRGAREVLEDMMREDAGGSDNA